MNSHAPRAAVTPEDVRMVSPALAQYTQDAIENDLWKRPALSSRDRSIVTVANVAKLPFSRQPKQKGTRLPPLHPRFAGC